MNLFAVTYSHRTRTAVALADDPPRLVLFDCGSYPPQEARQLPIEDPRLPRLLPVLDGASFVTAAGRRPEHGSDRGDLRNRLEIRGFEDLELQRVVDLDHSGDDDGKRTLDAVGSDPAGLRVAVVERGRLHLIDAASGEHHPARKVMIDRSEEVALDRRARFVMYSSIDQDTYYDGFRLAPGRGGDPLWIGTLGGSSREHHDRLAFSRFENAFAIASLQRRPRLQYFRFDPAVWESRELDPDAPGGATIDDGLPAEEVWSCEPADAVWIRRSGFDLPSADLAILDEDTLIYSGFRSVVVTDPQRGKILRRHDLPHRVQAVAADHVRGRILAATRGGLVDLPL